MSFKPSNFNITIVGAGYVGMSLGALLSKTNKVTILEIDQKKVDKINNGKSTIADVDMDLYLKKNKTNIYATLDKKSAFSSADYTIIATPTNYDENKGEFDTSSVDLSVEKSLKYNKNATIIIKSTVPIGHTDKLKSKFKANNIIFSPEFLQEGRALYDNLFPSRIVVGSKSNSAKNFGSIMVDACEKKNVKTLYVDSKAAESMKLFANTYLALRVSFFNELDSFAFENNINTHEIIEGLCLDERIGNHYNNPSFGYGGYCLPKDTKQLLSHYADIPQNLIQAIISSNTTRKDFIATKILQSNSKVIGIHRLAMKAGSENFRSSAIIGIINRLKKTDMEILIYEPNIKENFFLGARVINDIQKFKEKSDLIVANRISDTLYGEEIKIFTRDLFGVN